MQAQEKILGVLQKFYWVTSSKKVVHKLETLLMTIDDLIWKILDSQVAQPLSLTY